MKKIAFYFAAGYLVLSAILGTLTGTFFIMEWISTPSWKHSQAIQSPAQLDLAPELVPYTMFRPQTTDPFPAVQMPAKPGDTSGAEIQINKYGFRYGPLTKEKPDNTLRIFIIGGSVVFYGHTNQTTISGYLEQKLTERYPQKKVQVINAGVTGYISDQEWVLLATCLTDFSPDAIIVFDGYNDFLMPSSMEQRLGYPFKFKTLELTWYSSKNLLHHLLDLPFIDHLKAGSHFLRRYNPNWSYLAYLRDEKIAPPNSAVSVPSADAVANHLTENWRKMALFADSFKIKGLFVLQPFHEKGHIFSDQYDAVEQEMKDLNSEFADNNDSIHFINYRHVMDNHQSLYYDQVHTYDEGNAIYAGLLLDTLSQIGI